MLLKWVGDSRYVQGVGGWPASDHEEPNAKTARAKLKSKLYARVDAPEEEPPAAPLENALGSIMESAKQEEAN
jgi:hypothetical protein